MNNGLIVDFIILMYKAAKKSEVKLNSYLKVEELNYRVMITKTIAITTVINVTALNGYV